MARKTGSDGQKTARDIRSAALRLFAEKGYAAVSMREIARDVGVQAGALYLYTPDKQSLLADLMISHLQDLMAAWKTELARVEADPVARLDCFVRFHIRYHLQRIDEVFIAYMELRNLVPENFTRVETLRRSYERELENILAAGQSLGQFKSTDTRITPLAIIAMLNGVMTWFRDGGRLSRSDIETLYLGHVRRLVGLA